MEKSSSATPETDMPPIPTFSFNKKDPIEVEAASVVEQERSSHDSANGAEHSTVKTESSSKSGKVKSKKSTKNSTAGDTSVQIVSPPVIFSTEVRRSIQIDLAIISHERFMSGSKKHAIKQLLHEALVLWLDSPTLTESQMEKKRKLMQFPVDDPYDSFNNRISLEVNRRLGKLKFEREGALHPVRTKKAFTEEALINWIPLQDEFSVEERTKRLSQRAA